MWHSSCSSICPQTHWGILISLCQRLRTTQAAYNMNPLHTYVREQTSRPGRDLQD